MFDLNKSTNNDTVLKITVWLLLPIIFLYSLYIQIHGEVSPGGGFQSGVIFSVGYILFLITFGTKVTQQLLSSEALIKLAVFGILIYIVTGIITIFLGGNFLEYEYLNFVSQPQQLGLFLVELGIGICVFGSMSKIIFTFYTLLEENNKDFS